MNSVKSHSVLQKHFYYKAIAGGYGVGWGPYPDSSVMEAGSCSNKSQDLILGCGHVTSLQGRAEEEGKKSGSSSPF